MTTPTPIPATPVPAPSVVVPTLYVQVSDEPLSDGRHPTLYAVPTKPKKVRPGWRLFESPGTAEQALLAKIAEARRVEDEAAQRMLDGFGVDDDGDMCSYREPVEKYIDARAARRALQAELAKMGGGE